MNTPKCGAEPCYLRQEQSEDFTRLKQGDREVYARLHYWICDKCGAYNGRVPPLKFVDEQLGAINDKALCEEWLKKYGEPFKSSRTRPVKPSCPAAPIPSAPVSAGAQDGSVDARPSTPDLASVEKNLDDSG